MKSFLKYSLSIVLIVALLAGCSFGAGNDGLDKKKQESLKVMFYEESSFYEEYGMLFSALYPNIDIQVLSTSGIYAGENVDYEAATLKFIEDEKPDIVLLQADQYKKLASEGKLYDLDPSIEKDKYNTEGLVPGMIDYLKELGGGKVYGLTPNFYSQAVYYNKELFDKFKIPHPTDQMSFDEMIQLARQFPTEGEEKERVYGLKFGYSESLFELASMLATSEGIQFVNPAKKEMTINSDAWKDVYQTALDALNSKALYFENRSQDMSVSSNSYEEHILRDPFISGRLAMVFGDNNYISQIKQAEDNIKDKTLIVKNWDLVTVPVSKQNPDQSSYMSFNNLLAITEQSPNKEAAWKFLQYVTGDEYARVKSKSRNYNGFPVRTNYIKDDGGHNLAAFYKLKPSSFNGYKDFDKLPQNFWMEFNGAAEQELQPLKEGTASIDEVLQKLQVIGQELLLKEDTTAPVEGKELNSEAEVEVEVEVEPQTESVTITD